MTDIKPLSELRRASKLMGDYHLAVQGYAGFKQGERERYVPNGMCTHIWKRHVNADLIKAQEENAWLERIGTIRSKLLALGYTTEAEEKDQ